MGKYLFAAGTDRNLLFGALCGVATHFRVAAIALEKADLVLVLAALHPSQTGIVFPMTKRIFDQLLRSVV